MAANNLNNKVDGKFLSKRETLLFLHIPKTAGTSLDRIISRQYPKSATCSAFPLRRNWIDDFKNLPEADRAKIQYVRVHPGPFGLHEYLPQPSIYATMLRDPVDRILSLYFFLLSIRDEEVRHRFLGIDSTSLDDFVRAGTNSNVQTRMISGVAPDSRLDNSALPSDILQVAKRNIQEHFCFAGVVERFDESLILLKRYFGWRNVLYTRMNVTKKRAHSGDIPKGTLTIIEQSNELDISLYEWVKREFERILREQEPSFGLEVQRFQRYNKVYQRINRPFSILGRSLRSLRH